MPLCTAPELIYVASLVQARERLTSYKSRLNIRIRWTVTGPDHEPVSYEEVKDCGLLPVLVRVSDGMSARTNNTQSDESSPVQSSRCNLKGLSAAQLVERHEESSSWGGYFIVNGNEKIIRYLILPRRHHPIGLVRPSFVKRGPTYSQYGCQIRCVRPDQTACTNTLHYLTTGGATLRFAWRKNEYMIPLVLVLKALTDASDREIFEGIVQGEHDNTFLTDRVELLLRSAKTWGLHSGVDCLAYLGEKFRVVLGCPEDWPHHMVGNYLLRRVVLVHLPKPRDKFALLLWVVTWMRVALSAEHPLCIIVSCCASSTRSSLALAARTTPTRRSIKRSCCPATSTA